MKIGIDISAVVYGTGVSVYTKKLVENLLLVDKKNEYVLFGGSLRRQKDLRDFVKTLKGVSFKGKVFPISPTIAHVLWNRLHVLPVERLIGKVDVFHSSDWTQPPCKANKVTTVHDLSHLKFPQNTHPKIVSVQNRRLKWIIKEVDKIIVPSNATKSDLIEIGLTENKIKVIAEAAVHKLARDAKVEKVKEKCGLKRKYLLSVGINPRKNTDRIIKAFERVRKNNDVDLVLVGHPSFINIKESNFIKILGHVSDEELAALYSGAEVLVYPSLYEGFGIPILDAFNCKTPVVTSNISSMPEVAGDAAILVDPSKVDSIEKGIMEALNDRERYVKRGLARVKKYSWEQMARQTLKVYESVYS